MIAAALRKLGLPSLEHGLISERSYGDGRRTDLRDDRTVVELKLFADLPALKQLLGYRASLTTPDGPPAAHLVCGVMPTASLLRQARIHGVKVWGAGLKIHGGVALAPIEGPDACWPWS